MLLYSILQSLSSAPDIANITFATKFIDKETFMTKGHAIVEISRKKRGGFKKKSLVNSIETAADGSFNLFYQLGGGVAYLR